MEINSKIKGLITQKEFIEKAYKIMKYEDLDDFSSTQGIDEEKLAEYLSNLIYTILNSELCQDVHKYKLIDNDSYYNLLSLLISFAIFRETNLLENFFTSSSDYDYSVDSEKIINNLEEALNELDPDPIEFIATLRKFLNEFFYNKDISFNFSKDINLKRKLILTESVDEQQGIVDIEEYEFTAIEILFLFVLRYIYTAIVFYYEPYHKIEDVYLNEYSSYLYGETYSLLNEYLTAINELIYREGMLLALYTDDKY